MPWLPEYAQGRTPAELSAAAQIHGGNLPASLFQRRNSWEEAVAKIAPAITDYLKRKKADEIANAMMNWYQPPRAQAVDQYGATYDPALAARQGLTGPEPMPSQPFRGGEEGLEAYQLYRKMQHADEDQAMQREWNRTRIDNYGKPRTSRQDGVPRNAEGLTPYQVRQLELAREREDRLADSASRRGGSGGYAKEFNSAVGDEGITADMMAGVDTETPNVVEYQDAEGNKISADAARVLGKGAFAVAPGFPPIELPKWNRAVAAYKRMIEFGQGGTTEERLPVKPKVLGRPTDSAADINRMPQSGGGPTTKNTPVQVSTPEEARALPLGTYYLDPQGKLHKR